MFVIAIVLSVVWYALVEWIYFSAQSATFRRIFSEANGCASPAAFSYRAPWLGIVTYIVLLTSISVLAIAPSLSLARGDRRRKNPGRAYLSCLWRSVLLAAAVYVTYDLTTFSTVFPFSFRHAATDLVYGIVVIPALVISPCAALLEYSS